MQITTKRWLAQSEGVPDMGAYKTTVTIRDTGVLCAITFPGTLSRKAALVKAWHDLQRSGQWSMDFLNRLRKVK